MKNKNIKRKWVRNLMWLSLTIVCLAGIYWVLKITGFIDLIMDTAQFKAYIISIGYWGSLLIVGLMAFAILFKLLPSAAVALASGAVYGHTWGTIYVVMGAWLGAIIAFMITRQFGNNAMCRLFKRQLVVEQEKSQAWLMWGLFVSRLIPVIPYDIVSYAMGLTPLKLWRFSIATLFGVIPTSFFLAHVGGKLADIDIEEMLSGMMTAGLVLLLPVIVIMLVYHRYGKFKGFFATTQCKK